MMPVPQALAAMQSDCALDAFQSIILGVSLVVCVAVALVAALAIVLVVVGHFWPELNMLEPLDDANSLKRSADRFAAEQSGWQA